MRGKPAPAADRERDVTALEDALVIVLIIGEAADRAPGFRCSARRSRRAIDDTGGGEVRQTAFRVGVVFREIGSRFEDVLAPAFGRVRTQELRGEQRAAVETLPLERARITAAYPVGLLTAELAADRRIACASEIGEAVGAGRRRAVTGGADRAGTVSRNRRRKSLGIRIGWERIAANRRRGGVQLRGVNAVAGLEVRHLHAVGAGEQARVRNRAEQSDAADARVPSVADKERSDGRPLFRKIAVARFGVEADVESLVVEGQAQVHVDGAGKAALNAVGRLFLEDLDGAEQLGRHVLEVDGLAVDACREGVAPVELGPDEGEAANGYTGTFGGEVVGIAAAGEAVDRDAGDALQRLGHRTVGEGADVLRGDHVDDGVGVALDLLRALQALADAGDDDGAARVRAFLRAR